MAAALRGIALSAYAVIAVIALAAALAAASTLAHLRVSKHIAGSPLVPYGSPEAVSLSGMTIARALVVNHVLSVFKSLDDSVGQDQASPTARKLVSYMASPATSPSEPFVEYGDCKASSFDPNAALEGIGFNNVSVTCNDQIVMSIRGKHEETQGIWVFRVAARMEAQSSITMNVGNVRHHVSIKMESLNQGPIKAGIARGDSLFSATIEVDDIRYNQTFNTPVFSDVTVPEQIKISSEHCNLALFIVETEGSSASFSNVRVERKVDNDEVRASLTVNQRDDGGIDVRLGLILAPLLDELGRYSNGDTTIERGLLIRVVCVSPQGTVVPVLGYVTKTG